MPGWSRRAHAMSCVLALALGEACASLGPLARLIQPPRFEQGDRAGEIQLTGPSANRPLGGATVRVWTKVTNPNPIGFTLSLVRATLIVEGEHAADGEFPLGLPLGAGQQSTIPFDLAIDFSDIPALANIVKRAAAGRSLAYRLDGTVGVEAGSLGRPTFGPMTLVTGELRVAGF
jgi:hypothetical protein